MKNSNHHRRYTKILAALSLLLCLSAAPALAAPMRVAVLPFEVNAEKDLTYLQEGILDMLSSRLAWQDKVEVINKAEVKSVLDGAGGFEGESRALLIGGKLKADYVLFGSLTVFGDSVSIDSRMVDVSGQREPLPFFVQTRTINEVIPQINQFATDINQNVFGRAVARPAVAATPQTGTAPAYAGQPGAQQPYDPRMHPEKLMASGIQEDYQGAVAGQGAAPNPAFVATGAGLGAGRNVGGFWKSRSFKEMITGIAVADVDGDGLNDVVVVTEKQVTVHKMQNGQLIQASEIAKTRTSTYISVDVADINGNGTPEIYVSSIGPNRSTADSFVLEHAGGSYKTLLENETWYYRVVDPVVGVPLLLGQQQRTAEESIFMGEIYEMDWEGGRLVPGAQVMKGGEANALGLTLADITDSGDKTVVAYSDWDRLRLYSGAGEMMWEDGDRSGGNTAYFELPRVERGEPNYQYFPLRVRTTDINQDGKPEILIARHDELARNMLKDFRSFSKARIESLGWDGLGLVPVWKTRTFAGRASDFVVGDFDNDGVDELVIAVVSKEGAIAFTSAKSSLIAFDLNPQ